MAHKHLCFPLDRSGIGVLYFSLCDSDIGVDDSAFDLCSDNRDGGRVGVDNDDDADDDDISGEEGVDTHALEVIDFGVTDFERGVAGCIDPFPPLRLATTSDQDSLSEDSHMLSECSALSGTSTSEFQSSKLASSSAECV